MGVFDFVFNLKWVTPKSSDNNVGSFFWIKPSAD